MSYPPLRRRPGLLGSLHSSVSMAPTLVLQDSSMLPHPPPSLTQSVTRTHLWLVNNGLLPQRGKTQKPLTEETYSQTTLDCPHSWPPSLAQTACFQPCPVAGSCGHLPLPLAHLCLRTPEGAHTLSADTGSHWSSNMRKCSPSLGFCFILAFLLLMHYSVFPCKI